MAASVSEYLWSRILDQAHLNSLEFCCDEALQENVHDLVGIYMFKVNNGNTRTGCEISSKLTIKTPERRSGVFIVNFEHYFTRSSSVSIVDFEQVNIDWGWGEFKEKFFLFILIFS